MPSGRFCSTPAHGTHTTPRTPNVAEPRKLRDFAVNPYIFSAGCTLVADAQQPQQPVHGAQRESPCGNMGTLPVILLVTFLFMYLFMIRPQSRQRSQKEQMLRNLKKNDKVVTIGGILGTVTNVQADSNEVTIKVDDSNNTKIRILRSAIHEVLRDGGEDDKPAA